MSRLLEICVLLSACACVWGRIRNFPDGFQFGASTAAYQIEGGWCDGKGISIWDVATHESPSPIKDHSNGDVAADSYHLYRRDVEMMRELGLDFYRFSISWTRILPSGFTDRINQAGINYYHNLLTELHRNSITPFVTMYHWDLPENLQKLGGWANPLVVDWFVDYARVLFDKFGNRVPNWITINEPKQICYEGYGSDKKAPFLNMSGIAEYLCAKNVLLAHARVYQLYDEHYRHRQNGTIGISISGTWYQAASDSPDDRQAAIDARRFDWGMYAHPIFSRSGDFPYEVKRNVAQRSAEQGYRKSRLPELTASEVALIRGSSDFFGLNTYTTKLAYRDASVEGLYAYPSYNDDIGAVFIKDSSWPQAESSWLQEVPWGFRKLLVEIKDLYDNPPVLITENGWSTSGGLVDDDRINYHRNYLNALLDAVEDGCDVKAYSAWSLMDNFEWRNGYTEKFGLYEVDFNSHERTRTARKSAYVYKEIIRSHQLDINYEPEDFNGNNRNYNNNYNNNYNSNYNNNYNNYNDNDNYNRNHNYDNENYSSNYNNDYNRNHNNNYYNDNYNSNSNEYDYNRNRNNNNNYNENYSSSSYENDNYNRNRNSYNENYSSSSYDNDNYNRNHNNNYDNGNYYNRRYTDDDNDSNSNENDNYYNRNNNNNYYRNNNYDN